MCRLFLLSPFLSMTSHVSYIWGFSPTPRQVLLLSAPSHLSCYSFLDSLSPSQGPFLGFWKQRGDLPLLPAVWSRLIHRCDGASPISRPEPAWASGCYQSINLTETTYTMSLYIHSKVRCLVSVAHSAWHNLRICLFWAYVHIHIYI